MAWKAGQSGNPSGKSKEQAAFEKKCREFLDREGYSALEQMARSSDKRVKMWALERIMDRGFGRPKEMVDVTSRDESKPSLDQITSDIAELVGERPSQGSTGDQSAQGTA